MALFLWLLSLAGKVFTNPDIGLAINSQVPPVARIGKPFTFTFSGATFTSDSGILDYVVTDTPAWLYLNAASRTLSGTPAPDAAGSPKFSLVATDITGSTTMSVTLVVSTSAGPSLDMVGFSAAVTSFRVTVENHILTFEDEQYTISVTPGQIFHYNRLQGALRLNGILTDYLYVRNVYLETPSWMLFDRNSWVLSSIPPPSARSQNVSVSAVDIYDEVAVTTMLLQIETNSTAELFNNMPDNVYATAGEDFKYAFNSSGISTSDAEIAVDLGLASSWLSFDPELLELSGRVPKGLPS
ncbi:MAG: hypothetical protein Q9221_007173 [Calogaya cf. arnoldii]